MVCVSPRATWVTQDGQTLRGDNKVQEVKSWSQNPESSLYPTLKGVPLGPDSLVLVTLDQKTPLGMCL